MRSNATTGKTLPPVILAGLALLGLTFSGTSVADVYRCTRSDGKMEYRQQPCTAGAAQKTIDDTQARKRREDEDARRKFEQGAKEWREKNAQAEQEKADNKKKGAKTLAFCVSKEVECSEYSYTDGLHCMSLYEVEGILGAATQSQNIGGQRYVYYTVPIHNGTAFVARKIQLVIGICGDAPGPNKSDRVKEVNIY